MRKATIWTAAALAGLVWTSSAALGQATIEVGSIVGSGPIEVTLSTGGEEVAGTENEIAFDAGAQITGCAVNPEIDRTASAFSFSPSGCTPGDDCESVKALILSFTNTDPLPDGVRLYTCDVAATGAAGDYPLTCSAPGASDPTGNSIDTNCSDGNVNIPDVPKVNISVGSTTIMPGGAGSLDVTLELLDDTAEVAATENVLSFAPETQIARCTVNPDINRDASAFSLSPSGCAPGVDCESIKALVLSFTDLSPLEDGTLLYSCDVVSVPAGSAAAVVSGASTGTAEGTFPVLCSEPGSSDPAGGPLSTTCSDGEVVVVAPTATPTVTVEPTAPPTEDATATPTEEPTEEPTNTRPPLGPDDDDSCAVVAPQSNSGGWMLLLPLAGLLWLRRRR